MTLTRKISIVAVVTGLFIALAAYSWQHKYDPRTYGYNPRVSNSTGLTRGDSSARKDEVSAITRVGMESPIKHRMTQQERLAAYVYLFTDNGRF